MKKNIKSLLAALFAALFLSSCGSVQSLLRDPDFHEGFRQGWNSTAPEEYRY